MYIYMSIVSVMLDRDWLLLISVLLIATNCILANLDAIFTFFFLSSNWQSKLFKLQYIKFKKFELAYL